MGPVCGVGASAEGATKAQNSEISDESPSQHHLTLRRPAPVSRAKHYRAHAVQCKEQAKHATEHSVRRAYRHLATTWFHLADEVEWLVEGGMQRSKNSPKRELDLKPDRHG